MRATVAEVYAIEQDLLDAEQDLWTTEFLPIKWQQKHFWPKCIWKWQIFQVQKQTLEVINSGVYALEQDLTKRLMIMQR